MNETTETEISNSLEQYRQASAELATYVLKSCLTGSELLSDEKYRGQIALFLAREVALDLSLRSAGVNVDLARSDPGPSPVMQPHQSYKDTLQTPLN